MYELFKILLAKENFKSIELNSIYGYIPSIACIFAHFSFEKGITVKIEPKNHLALQGKVRAFSTKSHFSQNPLCFWWSSVGKLKKKRI